MLPLYLLSLVQELPWQEEPLSWGMQLNDGALTLLAEGLDFHFLASPPLQKNIHI